jgi:hypothetical protein
LNFFLHFKNIFNCCSDEYVQINTDADTAVLFFRNGPITPDPDLLLKEVCDGIKQTLIIDDIKFSVDILLFKADLPARALATKHIHHNGYYGCLECDQRGVWCEDGHIVVYPCTQDLVNLRTPAHFDFCAKMVDGQSSVNNHYGVKGFSPLANILNIPAQVDLDVMHLCFIGHCSLLLSKWEKMIIKQAWLSGNDFLKNVRWPHNFNVELHSFVERTHWKAHDYRAFFLYLMFPFVFSFFPDYISSHFSLYFVFIRTLYFYHDFNEVLEVEPLMKLYYQHALPIYGQSFYLYSTHAHLHLVEKVTSHGALCFHNCFGNESFIRFIRSLRSSNRFIARQICRSFDKSRCITAKETLSINNIFTDEKLILDDYLDRQYISKYQSQFLDTVENVIDSTDNPYVCFFCRASRGISEFHSLSYRRRGNTQSFVVSFYDDKNNKCFGQVIFFYKLFDVSYAFLNMYDTTVTYFSSNNYVHNWSFSPSVPKFLDKYYAKCDLSNTKFVSVPFSSVLYKCIVIYMSDQTLLSEIFYDSDQS